MSDDRSTSMPDLANHWVVLGEHAIDEFCQLTHCAPVDGTWTPDLGLVAEIAPVLTTALQNRLDDLAARVAALGLPIWGDPHHASDYFVQCVGIIRARLAVVWLNGFRRPPGLGATRLGDKWRTSLVYIFDGGPNSFRAEYDPATQQIVKLRFNGPYGSTNPAVDR